MPNATSVWNFEQAEIGYKSGTGANKFNVWYNQNVGNIGNYAWAWCQAFQTWAFTQAGVECPKTAHCQTALNWWNARGRYNRTPKIGDQIFYDWGDGGMADHVGFVANLDSTYVYTIEGNTGAYPGQVGMHKYARSSGFILGYGHPDYNGVSTPPVTNDTQESNADATVGSVVVTNVADLNWRTAPNTSSESVAVYDIGAEVQCVGFVYGQDPYNTGENRWVKSAARGLYAWAGGIADISGLRQLDEGSQSKPSVPKEDHKTDFWVTCKQATIWRTKPDKNAVIFAQYEAGAKVLCSSKDAGSDPYGDGRNIWYRSARNGVYCWQGTIE